ncbi:hypothetical protein DICVIV_03960 [Dictyocaulus viviparus]|uniref:Uncharacterized protein n=1 Tax=Dictyocaulus viviparus TaxID=29172 RepID=A0A0D8XZN4_DICVI|nr:hypothetical protein DICVIV_03960 [Dictyocaulus viviparus]
MRSIVLQFELDHIVEGEQHQRTSRPLCSRTCRAIATIREKKCSFVVLTIMAAFFRKLFVSRSEKRQTRKDSITGRNKTLSVPYLSRLDGTHLQPGQSLIIRGVITGKSMKSLNVAKYSSVEYLKF